MLNWFEAWFNSPYYHLLYKHRDQGEAGRFISRLLDHLQPASDARFLDLACGAGRHSLFLNRLNFDVTGVDISQNNIEMASKYEREGLRFQVHDMRDPLPGEPYDYILNLFTSFGYFEDDSDHLKTLLSVKQSLKNKGVFVLDFMNARKVLSDLVEEEEVQKGEVFFHIRRYHKDGWLYKEIEIKDGLRHERYREEVRLLFDDDFKTLFQNAGFKISNIFGDYQLNEYHKQKSDRLILLATR
jgi:SAM-dependent methyltransferase